MLPAPRRRHCPPGATVRSGPAGLALAALLLALWGAGPAGAEVAIPNPWFATPLVLDPELPVRSQSADLNPAVGAPRGSVRDDYVLGLANFSSIVEGTAGYGGSTAGVQLVERKQTSRFSQTNAFASVINAGFARIEQVQGAPTAGKRETSEVNFALDYAKVGGVGYRYGRSTREDPGVTRVITETTWGGTFEAGPLFVGLARGTETMTLSDPLTLAVLEESARAVERYGLALGFDTPLGWLAYEHFQDARDPFPTTPAYDGRVTQGDLVHVFGDYVAVSGGRYRVNRGADGTVEVSTLDAGIGFPLGKLSVALLYHHEQGRRDTGESLRTNALQLFFYYRGQEEKKVTGAP